ncbi:Ribosomal protein L41 [Dillenia turbinata]|uniref:60S ribosomal protein L41 n=1 Tax=Dillenia turbinata TaxID=194707 RepID=A0AAN8VPX5_9MAGN
MRAKDLILIWGYFVTDGQWKKKRMRRLKRKRRKMRQRSNFMKFAFHVYCIICQIPLLVFHSSEQRRDCDLENNSIISGILRTALDPASCFDGRGGGGGGCAEVCNILLAFFSASKGEVIVGLGGGFGILVSLSFSWSDSGESDMGINFSSAAFCSGGNELDEASDSYLSLRSDAKVNALEYVGNGRANTERTPRERCLY